MEEIHIGYAAYDAKQMDNRRRKKIISNEEMAPVDAGTMDVALASEAEKVTHTDKEVVIASREKPTVIQKRHSTKKVKEKSEEKSEKTIE
jgi:hypothetical protein